MKKEMNVYLTTYYGNYKNSEELLENLRQEIEGCFLKEDIVNEEEPVVEETIEETPVEEPTEEVEETEEVVEDTPVEETPEEEPEHELTEDEYLDDLIGQLNDALANDEDMVDEEEVVEETKPEEPDLYTQINQLYPYLSRGFVRAVYDLKETIANEYPVNHNVIILHRLSFKSVNGSSP